MSSKRECDAVKFVAYYRVSTAKQGRSGLGLEAQRASVEAYVKDGQIIGEYVEGCRTWLRMK
jgi:DNA invertase Pin-like site-specific DNA recombinase